MGYHSLIQQSLGYFWDSGYICQNENAHRIICLSGGIWVSDTLSLCHSEHCLSDFFVDIVDIWPEYLSC